MPNLVSALLDEIERVVAKRERWKHLQSLDSIGQVTLGPGIQMMTAAIVAGKAAISEDNAILSLRAYEMLRGFNDQD